MDTRHDGRGHGHGRLGGAGKDTGLTVTRALQDVGHSVDGFDFAVGGIEKFSSELEIVGALEIA